MLTLKIKTMRTLLFFFTTLFCLVNSLGKKNATTTYFQVKPIEIELKSDQIQEYEVALKWQNRKALHGDVLNTNIATGIYTIMPDGPTANWNSVCLSNLNDFRGEKQNIKDLTDLEDFSYTTNSTDFLSEDFFTTINKENRDLAKWLVCDAMQMHGLATYVFDNMSFQEPFYPKLLEDYDIQFENWVLFKSTYQKLVWSGITQHNNEICAIVKFESFYNPVVMDTPEMTFKGRSLYYGEMWISLEDKQVEYSIMIEDVVFRLKSAKMPQPQLLNLQREVVFDKIN